MAKDGDKNDVDYDHFTSDTSPTGNIQVKLKVRRDKKEIQAAKRVGDTSEYKWVQQSIPLWIGIVKPGEKSTTRFVCCNVNPVCTFMTCESMVIEM